MSSRPKRSRPKESDEDVNIEEESSDEEEESSDEEKSSDDEEKSSDDEEKSSDESESEGDLSQRELDEINAEARSKENRPAEFGIIEEITLINFMSHKNLHLKLGPQTNFITGPNGAGKSAILVALTTALGARTNFTGRGTKLSDLVNNSAEAQWAQITVRLRNRGPEAYRHDVYGDAIVVVKRIPKEGASSLRILNHAEQATDDSTTSRLSDILDHFNIQINNPCSILMQDTSKGFLANSTPKAKYAFFLKATQLENIRNDYAQMDAYLRETSELVKRKVALLPQMKEHLQACEEAYKLLNIVNQLEDERRKLRMLLAWATYGDERRRLDGERRKKERCEQELAKRQADLDALTARREQLQHDVQVVEDEVAGLVETLQTEARQRKAHDEQLRAERQALATAERRTAALLDNRAKKQLRAERLRAGIEKERRENTAEIEAEIAQLAADLLAKQNELLSLQTALDASRRAADAHASSVDEAQARLADVQRRRDALERERSDAYAQLVKLQRAAADRAAAFGERVPQLLELVARRRDLFRRDVVGPVGLHLSVREPRWLRAIELHCGATLRAMVVDNMDDQRALQRLAHECRIPNLSVIVQQFREPYAIAPSMMPAPHITTVLSQLDVAVPVLHNVLVDHCEVERVALFDSYEEAKHTMFTSEERRANIALAVLQNGTRMSNRRGTQNIRTAPPDKGLRLLQPDPQAQAALFEQRKSRAEQALEALAAEYAAVRREVDALQQQKRQLDRVLQRDEAAVSSVNSLVRSLHADKLQQERRLEAERNSHHEKSELETQLDLLLADVAGFDQQLADSEAETARLRADVEALQARAPAGDAEKLERAQRLKKELTEREQELAQVQQKIGRSELFVRKLHQALEEQIDPAIAQIEATIAGLHDTARSLGGQPPDDDLDALPPPDELEKQIDVLTNRIHVEQQGRRSAEEVTHEYLTAKKKYNATAQAIKDLNKFLQNATRSMDERVKLWKSFRKSIADRTRSFFNANLSLRGHLGGITFDHDEETLDVQVTINKSAKAATAAKSAVMQTTKSLSGGERSFSTVSLLLALWETMDVPFRAMDEFDVFMDGPNRKIAINLLQQSAFNHPQRQFIFITPHDPSVIHRNEMVKIHQLKAPREASSRSSLLGYASQSVPID